MAHLAAHHIYDEDGNDRAYVASTFPASPASVATVLTADPDLTDGMTRSQWMWVRLANGDLILGIYPQDETYFSCEIDAEFPRELMAIPVV